MGDGEGTNDVGVVVGVSVIVGVMVSEGLGDGVTTVELAVGDSVVNKLPSGARRVAIQPAQ